MSQRGVHFHELALDRIVAGTVLTLRTNFRNGLPRDGKRTCLMSKSLPDYGPAALFLRLQKMDNESMAKEERAAMNAAAADLLAVKLHKPGWPGLKP